MAGDLSRSDILYVLYHPYTDIQNKYEYEHTHTHTHIILYRVHIDILCIIYV